ncbi:hypothetical protein INT46_006182, partial [Mucor plumbeus]
MISKDLNETVNRSFRDIMKTDASFGDVFWFLPVVQSLVSQCLNKANFWSQVRSLQLHTNMRDHQALQSDDANLAAELQQFDSFSINVGQGDVPTC